MPSLLTIYNLRNDSQLKALAIAACMKAAEAIRNEDVNTKNHTNRLIWANKTPDENAIALMPSLAMNDSIQKSFEVDVTSISDNDIEFIVNSNIDRFATGG